MKKLFLSFFLVISMSFFLTLQSMGYAAPAAVVAPVAVPATAEVWESGHYQEALWAYDEKGDRSSAEVAKVKLQEMMERGKVIQSKNLGGGKNETLLLTIVGEKNTEFRAVFKPYNFFNVSSDYRAEIAAYLYDQLLGLNIVPMTVKRVLDDGTVGSLQYFMSNATVAKKLPPEKQVVPAKLRFFDYLVRGWDRMDNPGNYLFMNDTGRVVAIDHGWCFRTADWYHYLNGKAHMHLCNGRIKEHMPELKIYQRLKSLTAQDFYNALGGFLSKAQMRLVIKRKNHFIEEAEEYLNSVSVNVTTVLQ
ncbi:MAG: hypothetical protein HQK53_01675 [Oligoflexia bacterium]|nr:hypothetical protein [Oligoflexia bacterium]